MKKKIRSLDELRQAKKELALQREATRQEFGRQIKVVRKDVNALFFKRVVLPVGLGLIGALVFKYFWSRNEEQEEQEVNKASAARQQAYEPSAQKDDEGINWMSMISVGLSLLRLLQNMRDGNAEPGEQDHRTHETATTTGTASESGQESLEEESYGPKDFLAGYQQFVREKAKRS